MMETRVSLLPLTTAILLALAGAASAGQNPSPNPRPNPRSEAGRPSDSAPQARRGPARTDQTIAVQRGARLVLGTFAGDVVIRAWEKDAVHVVAEHSTRERVDIQSGDQVVRVQGRSEHGVATADFAVDVPRWMAVNVNGTYIDASVEGTEAEITVTSVGGDVHVKGGSGVVTLKSVEGSVSLEGANGRLSLASVNEGIIVRNCTGELTAETVNGDVRLERVDSPAVDANTVNGDVLYEGAIRDGGSYVFSSHNGEIVMRVPDAVNATVFVRTFQGEFATDFPVKLPEADRAGSRRNRRVNFTLGNGSARIELQSFGGDIQLRKATAKKD